MVHSRYEGRQAILETPREWLIWARVHRDSSAQGLGELLFLCMICAMRVKLFYASYLSSILAWKLLVRLKYIITLLSIAITHDNNLSVWSLCYILIFHIFSNYTTKKSKSDYRQECSRRTVFVHLDIRTNAPKPLLLRIWKLRLGGPGFVDTCFSSLGIILVPHYCLYSRTQNSDTTPRTNGFHTGYVPRGVIKWLQCSDVAYVAPHGCCCPNK